ncbi:hypothetical protein EV356DRAFT_390102 [Viridothelium virens]|uniref:Uncharacterized protein n=1 Tax=Viridothelium virens TaxID=1048519 RepID=A0A6A6GUT4_VIRVR|nr:hypothetical protein EV356DRAFT_390102 [Viridothelium virens]
MFLRLKRKARRTNRRLPLQLATTIFKLFAKSWIAPSPCELIVMLVTPALPQSLPFCSMILFYMKWALLKTGLLARVAKACKRLGDVGREWATSGCVHGMH